MDKLGVARVYAQYRRLRLTGSPAAARHLIDALGSKDENVHTLAGILLVRAGKQSVRGLKAAIAGRHPEMVTCLEILGDIGGAVRVEPRVPVYGRCNVWCRGLAGCARRAPRGCVHPIR